MSFYSAYMHICLFVCVVPSCVWCVWIWLRFDPPRLYYRTCTIYKPPTFPQHYVPLLCGHAVISPEPTWYIAVRCPFDISLMWDTVPITDHQTHQHIGYAVYIDHKLQWCRHQMRTFSASLAICEGNPPVTGGFPSQRPLRPCFDVFYDLCPKKKRLSKHWRRRWFETPLRSLWHHCNATMFQIS